MTITITFDAVADLDCFYNKFVNSKSKIIENVNADLSKKAITIVTNAKTVEDEKVIINNIKQYMRDNNVLYNISV